MGFTYGYGFFSLFVSLAILGVLFNLARQTGHPLLYFMAISSFLGLLVQANFLVNSKLNGPVSAIVSDASQGLVEMQTQVARLLTKPVMAAVEEHYYRTGRPPLDRSEAGLSRDHSSSDNELIDSIQVVQGSIIVTFSRRASRFIRLKTLTMTPYETFDGDRHSVKWSCGNRPKNDAWDLLGTASGFAAARLTTTIPDEALPHECRGRR